MKNYASRLPTDFYAPKELTRDSGSQPLSILFSWFNCPMSLLIFFRIKTIIQRVEAFLDRVLVKIGCQNCKKKFHTPWVGSHLWAVCGIYEVASAEINSASYNDRFPTVLCPLPHRCTSHTDVGQQPPKLIQGDRGLGIRD